MKKKIIEKLSGQNIQNENANIDEYSFSGRRHEASNIVFKKLALKGLSRPVRKALLNNYIYLHDFDQYLLGEHNCLFIDFKKLFEEGFSTRNGDVRPPKSISTAMQQVAVIFQCQSQVQFGGVASMHLDYDLAPFVKMSFYKHFKDGIKYLYTGKLKEKLNETMSITDEKYKKYPLRVYKYAMDMLEKEGSQAAQGLYHNLNTLESRAGSQLPFTSINFGRDTSPEGRLVTKWLLNASIDGVGKHHRTSIFPISIFQLKKGVNCKKGDPNYDLKLLAIKSLSQRIYPNFVNCDWSGNVEDPNDIDTMMCTMGCRTMLGYNRFTNSYSKVGRGNITPVTIVLPKIGIEYGVCRGKRTVPDLLGFYKKLHEILKISEKSLIDRFRFMCKQSPKAAPFMYKNGTMRDTDKCENTVYNALKHGTLAIGFLGLAETLQALFGKNQLDEEAKQIGLDIVDTIYQFTKEASERNNLNFSCYFTPAENSCYTIMKKLQKEYGKIKNVTDKEFLTNSIHIPVWEDVDIFKKIDIESEFTKYGNAGCITYVEFDDNIKNNIKAVETVIDYAMEKDVPYMAINFPLDTCLDCGYHGEIKNKCPVCESDNVEHLARITGYLSTDVKNFNKGKQEEVKLRYKHSEKTNLGDNK